MFDALNWLNDFGIPYAVRGKNISEGWIGVDCPACGDRSHHGGISPTGESYSCFRCGKKLHITGLISVLANVSYKESKEIFSKYSDIFNVKRRSERERAAQVEWPPRWAQKHPEKCHTNYLKSRGYEVDQLIEKYGIMFGGVSGPFKYRILIPVYLRGRVVTYIGRDVTGESNLKYKNLKEELSVLPAKETVYNIDNIHEDAIICEGIFDAWRFGYNAVAIFGLVYTQLQVRILGDRLKRAKICLDSETQAARIANELAEVLSWQGVDVEIILIDAKDPGELTKEEADEIKNELFVDATSF